MYTQPTVPEWPSHIIHPRFLNVVVWNIKQLIPVLSAHLKSIFFLIWHVVTSLCLWVLLMSWVCFRQTKLYLKFKKNNFCLITLLEINMSTTLDQKNHLPMTGLEPATSLPAELTGLVRVWPMAHVKIAKQYTDTKCINKRHSYKKEKHRITGWQNNVFWAPIS